MFAYLRAYEQTHCWTKHSLRVIFQCAVTLWTPVKKRTCWSQTRRDTDPPKPRAPPRSPPPAHKQDSLTNCGRSSVEGKWALLKLHHPQYRAESWALLKLHHPQYRAESWALLKLHHPQYRAESWALLKLHHPQYRAESWALLKLHHPQYRAESWAPLKLHHPQYRAESWALCRKPIEYWICAADWPDCLLTRLPGNRIVEKQQFLALGGFKKRAV